MDFYLVALLGISVAINLFFLFKPKKYDGKIIVMTSPSGKRTFLLELDTNPDDLELLETILFKVTEQVNPEPETPD